MSHIDHSSPLHLLHVVDVRQLHVGRGNTDQLQVAEHLRFLHLLIVDRQHGGVDVTSFESCSVAKRMVERGAEGL